jgi:hypothetical protein
VKVSFESEAWTEYEEAAQYSEDRFGAGRNFVQAMQDALAAICKEPTRYQPVGQGVRIFRM